LPFLDWLLSGTMMKGVFDAVSKDELISRKKISIFIV
jgi:hypothetical protein